MKMVTQKRGVVFRAAFLGANVFLATAPWAQTAWSDENLNPLPEAGDEQTSSACESVVTSHCSFDPELGEDVCELRKEEMCSEPAQKVSPFAAINEKQGYTLPNGMPDDPFPGRH